MLDWWQALLYLLAGGFITVAASYVTHYWTTKASREAEERQAKRRLGEEQRQVIRQLRRERMQPILDSLDIVKRSAARQMIERTLDEVYEQMKEDVKPSLESWRQTKEAVFKDDPGVTEVTRGLSIAVFCGVSVPGLQHQLARIYSSVHPASDRKTQRQLGVAIRRTEQLIEQYLAGAEPHEPTADEPSQGT